MRTMAEIREAVKKYNEIIADKEVARMLWLEEKWERDKASEESRKYKAGLKEGELKERKEVTKKMQEKGYTVEEISEILDLTVEEIEDML